MVKVIHILGASGSGTTTLGRALQEKHGYIHFDSDDYFWLPTNPPYTTKREIADRQELLAKDMSKTDKRVISGSMCSWGDMFVEKFDLVIYIDTPTDIRIKRLEQRELAKFGDRVLQGGDMYNDHHEFIEWAITYDTAGLDSRSRALHQQWLKRMPCPVVNIDGTISIEKILEMIKCYI